jgi:hypothetical protein
LANRRPSPGLLAIPITRTVAYGELGALPTNSAFFTVVLGPDAQPKINPSIHPTKTVLVNIIFTH